MTIPRVLGLLVAVGACVISPLEAAPVVSEAVVIEMPNHLADKLIQQGRHGDPAPWKSIVSASGQLLAGTGAKLVVRLAAQKAGGGQARQEVSQKQNAETQAVFLYTVENAAAPAESVRSVEMELRQKPKAAGGWRFELCSPLTGEWSFSSRFRSKDGSRIVLEKSTFLKADKNAKSFWQGLRVLERERVVSGGDRELKQMEFSADAGEAYRCDWRVRDGDQVRFSYEETRNPGDTLPVSDRQEEPGDTPHFDGLGVSFSRNQDRYSCALNWAKITGKTPENEKDWETIHFVRTGFKRNDLKVPSAPWAVGFAAGQGSYERFNGGLRGGASGGSKAEVEMIRD